jgi:hypothetical protein
VGGGGGGGGVNLTAGCGFAGGEVRKVVSGGLGRCNDEPYGCFVLLCLCVNWLDVLYCYVFV